MGRLWDQIRRAIVEERVAVRNHADDLLRERGVLLWQVVASADGAKLIRERPDDRPDPLVEAQQLLPDGTPVKTVWAWLPYNQVAKLVTVHFFDHPA